MITVKVEHRRSDKENKDFKYIAESRLFISEDGSYFECDTDNPTQIIYRPYVRDGVSPRISVTGDFIPSDGMIYDTNEDEDINIVFTVDYDPPSKPSGSGGSGGSNPDTPTNPSTLSEGYTLTISYFKEESSEPYSVNSYTHYGAWVADPGGYMIMYYDYEGSKDPTDVTRSGGPLGYILERFETNISSDSSSPSVGDVYMNYYYIKPPTITVEINDATRGTTDPSPGNHIANGANIGGSFIVDAIPYEGYMLDYWSVNGNKITNSNSRYVHTVTGDATIKAWFKVDSSSSGTTTPDYSGVAENKMITNNELEEVSLYVFNKNGLDSSNCPTYSHISNANYNYNIISVKNNNGYESNQCVKYGDIEIGGINAKITVYNKTAWGFKCPVVYLGVKNNDTVSYHSNGTYDGAVVAWNDRTFTIPISCNASSGNWYSNSGSNKLYVKVDGSSWDSGRRIEIEINGTKYSSSKELKIEEQPTINLNTFLRNNYIIKVWVYPT